ncbi:MAG: hypothetical protein RJA44_1170 [Pseudomonadota bacterium]|jgi:lysozyme family protein
MADFAAAFEHTMKAEGGYVFDPADPGGETYKGIARKPNPKWEGWPLVDQMKRRPNFPRNLDTEATLQKLVRDFYELNYWDRVRGDELTHQDVAESIFDFAVNAGPITSIKLAQITVGVAADGALGPATLAKINADDPRAFLAVFALNKIGRYVSICDNRPESRKFFYGWVKRTLEGL